MVFGAALEPHPAKAKTGGEDAFFADDATSSFGIADGVGGSKRGGADPGIFSRRLLRYFSEHLQQQNATLRGAVTAAATGFAAETIGGSSTFIIGQLENESGAMRWLNLGDSGAVLFRPSRRKFDAGTFLWPRVVMRSVEVHKRLICTNSRLEPALPALLLLIMDPVTFDSREQQIHYFNCPFQVAAEEFYEAAGEADDLQTTARHGDILVAASDGVLDNLFEAHVQSIVAQGLVSGLLSADALTAQRAADECAQKIATEAQTVGLREDDESIRTPFQVAAAQEGYKFAGGKLDDVAVVVGIVRNNEGERPPPRQLHNFVD